MPGNCAARSAGSCAGTELIGGRMKLFHPGISAEIKTCCFCSVPSAAAAALRCAGSPVLAATHRSGRSRCPRVRRRAAPVRRWKPSTRIFRAAICAARSAAAPDATEKLLANIVAHQKRRTAGDPALGLVERSEAALAACRALPQCARSWARCASPATARGDRNPALRWKL